jgi:indole-3-glycerol phosphate synthase
LRPLIPAGRLVISESGIESRADVDELGRLGVDAVLVGESLLRAADLEAKVRELSGS